MRHPARFSDDLLPVIDELLGDALLVLDPFAGTGRIHELEGRFTVGVELEQEWATCIQGNALTLPFRDEVFDAVATSPAYGNRMADSYDGRDGSKRNTYRVALGRPLRPDNGGGMQWGDTYREFHKAAWVEALRVLKPGGRFVLNIKDHIRDGVRQYVTVWHTKSLGYLGMGVEQEVIVPLSGIGFGANSDARVPYESIILMLKDS